MELIEHYQPEFVARFDARATPCQCLACQQAEREWPHISVKMSNQQRESLDITCVTAAREMLFNPQAFILHTSQHTAQGGATLSPWSETLNQQCINLAIHPALPIEISLYAIGVLLSKAQQLLDSGVHEPAPLTSMGEQLAELAERGILTQQFSMLPSLTDNRIAALQVIGQMRLNLDLPLVEKMSMALKMSELSVMHSTRLAERLQELESIWLTITIFDEHPYILRNILLYQLYSDVFPGIQQTNYGAAMLELANLFFQIKILCAIRHEQSQLTEDDIVMLIKSLKIWLQQNPVTTDEMHTADTSLLHGLSLL